MAKSNKSSIVIVMGECHNGSLTNLKYSRLGEERDRLWSRDGGIVMR